MTQTRWEHKKNKHMMRPGPLTSLFVFEIVTVFDMRLLAVLFSHGISQKSPERHTVWMPPYIYDYSWISVRTNDISERSPIFFHVN